MKKGWESKKLGEVAKIGAGNSAPQDKSLFTNGVYPFFRTSDIGKIRIGGVSTAVDLLNDQGIKKLKLYPKGTILLPKSGASTFLNHRVILDVDGFVSSHLATVVCDEDLLDKRFALYYLIGIKAQDLIQDHSYPSLKLSDIKEIPIAVPPLEEQKQIVAKLDQCFEAIDKAKANATKNLENAKELSQSKLNELFSKADSTWKNITLLELLERGWITSHLDGNHGGNYPRKSEFVDSGIPYISANCLVGGEIDFKKAKYLTKERALLLRKGIARNNDVLFAHNATVGPTALLKTDQEKIILSTSLTYYRCNPDFINPEYLLIYLRSREFVKQYESVMSQSTRNQVPITKQRSFYHIIPPIEEQNDLAPKLNEFNLRLDKLVIQYSNELVNLEELKKSILQKAFEGEL